MSAPLNINLIIPFKDNKGRRLNLYRSEIEAFRGQLWKRVDELNGELVSLFGENFDLTLAARSDGSTKKYFWRFTSSKRDRNFNRLHADSVIEYVRSIDDARKLRLKETEEELIYINANLKLIKGMLDAIDQSIIEKQDLMSTEI